MYWNQMPLISKLNNDHFWCVSLMKESLLLEERNTAENSLGTITSKLVYSKSLGLKKAFYVQMRKRQKGFNVYGHVIGTIMFYHYFTPQSL